MYTSPSVSIWEKHRKSEKIRLLWTYILISTIYYKIHMDDYDNILHVAAVEQWQSNHYNWGFSLKD